MILMLNKSFDDLQEKAKAKLTELGFSTDPGSIVKLLLGIINEEFAEAYEALTISHTQAFLSTATGEFLDGIGLLLSCKRYSEEEDEDYRYRISKQILTTATSNETSVRLAALSVQGVKDVVLRNYALGAGSFSALILTEDREGDVVAVEQVRDAISKVAGYGIKFEVESPRPVEVKIKIKLITKDTVSDMDRQDLKYLVSNSLKDYFNTRKIGEPIIINQITQRTMEVSKDIISYACEDFRVDRKLSVYVNQECRWNERFIVSPEPDAILIV